MTELWKKKKYQLFSVFFIVLFFSTTLYAKDLNTGLSNSTVIVSEPGGIPEQVLKLYNKFVEQKGDSFSTKGKLSESQLNTAIDLMKNLYITAAKTGDAHGTVALLIKKGLPEDSLSQGFKDNKYKYTKISEDASGFMARAREQMIEDTLIQVLSSQKDMYVARSDTGNPDSGMRSDLDQTFFVFKVDPETGAKIRSPDLDQVFLDEFNKTWKSNYGELSLKMLDVVSMKGSARFPDPRFVAFNDFTTAHYSASADLRTQEGAYTSPDAITQQVHKRQYETLMQLLDKGVKTDPDNLPRVWQEYGKNTDSGDIGKISSPDYDFAIREMIGGSPELTPQAGFSAAIANWMMLEHSIKGNDFNVKYHLRTFDDSIYVQILMESGGGMEHKGEYAKMTPEQRSLIAKEAMQRLFPDDVKKQKHHKIAMDISAELRNQHTRSDKGSSGSSGSSLQTNAGGADYNAYEPLLKELYGKTYTPDDTSAMGKIRLETQLDAAKAYHKQLAREFSISSARRTAPDAFNAMKGGSICDEVRPFFEIEGRNWDETRGNIMEGARLTLLSGIYDLGMVEGLRLMKALDVEVDSSSWDLAKIYMEAQFLPIKTYQANPEVYNRAVKARVLSLVDDARNYALGEWGFEKVGEFEVSGTILKKQKLVWSGRKLFKNMFYDLGSVGSIASVAEVYVLSKGDLEKVLAKTLDEILLAVPILGQAESLRRGGVEGAVLMGAILYFPPAGKVLIAYNIGKSVYVIVDAEYYTPRRNNAVDAVYRGFAGPETKAYGEPGAPPPIWTSALEKDFNEKKKRLKEAKEIVDNLNRASRHAPSQIYLSYLPRNFPQDAEKELKKAEIEFQEIDSLHKKWIEYRDGNYAGGYMTGWGAVPEQIWIKDSFLDQKELEPVIGFLSGGVVDLRIDYDPAKAQAEILKLTVEAEKGETIEDQIRAMAKLSDLKLRKERYERAQRYIEQMKKNPEMKVRFIRDSIYANVQEKRIKMDAMVKNYFSANDERLYYRLLKEELIDPASPDNPARIGHEVFPTESDYNYVVPSEVKTLVRERLQHDYERSRRLLAAYKTLEKKREKEVEKEINRQIIQYQNQGFSKAKEQFKDDETFKKFLNVLRFSHIKRKAPEVKMTFFKSLSNSDKIKQGNPGSVLMEPHQLDLQVNVQVDPSIYNPPYNTRLFELTSEQVSSPPDSVDGVKFLPETMDMIKSLSQQYRKELEKGERFIAVGSVSCSSVNPMKGADPKTLQGLPGYENGIAVSGEVILGQQVQAIEAQPFKVFVDPIKIKIIDAAGYPISDENCFVKIGENETTNTSGGYWGTHTFTRYEEELLIEVNYKFTEDRIIKASAILSINDIKNWIEPSLTDEIIIELPVLMPESVNVKGMIKVNKVSNTISLSKTAKLTSGTLGINKYVGIPGPDSDSDGAFSFQSDRALIPGESIKLTAQASGTAKIKSSGKKKESVTSIQYNGIKTIIVPAKGGKIDAGTLTLNGNVKLVAVPQFDSSSPTPVKNYMAKVKKAGLIPKPSIVDKPDDPRFAHCVKGTTPAPGSRVPPGSDVAIEIYSAGDTLVPDVVKLHIKAATDILKEKKITARPKITMAPPRPSQEFTVISQSIDPGTKANPGLEIQLEIYGRAADMIITVPDLKNMTLSEAAKAIQDSGLRLERDNSLKPAPDLRHEGLIYKQTPEKGKPAKPNQTVTAWVYGKEGTGGEATAVADNNRPYYVVFSLSIQVPDEKYGKLKLPEKRENETKESYTRRVRVFVNSIPLNRLKIQELPAKKMILPFHVSGAGLSRYPRNMFLPGNKASAKIIMHNLKPKPGDPAYIKGALLLKVLGVYNSKQEVMDTYPKAKETKQLSTLALATADGTCQTKQNKNDIRIGPITLGWKANDIRESWNLWKEFYIAFGKLQCFVATVSYNNENNPYFVSLRNFRDQVLMQTKAGQRLVQLYYRNGPTMAAFIINHDLQNPTRKALDLIAKALKPKPNPNRFNKILLQTSIKTAGTLLPKLESFLSGNLKQEKPRLYLNLSLMESIVVDLFKGEPK